MTRSPDASSTGAALVLTGAATVGVAYLSRDHVPDWPFFEGVRGLQGETSIAMPAQQFTTINITQIISDTHGGSTGNIYTVPQSGIYEILFKFRIDDVNMSGGSYGVGVHTTTSDGPWFSWYSGNVSRQGAIYARTAPFVQGDPLRAYFYIDTGGRSYNVVDLVIARIR